VGEPSLRLAHMAAAERAAAQAMEDRRRRAAVVTLADLDSGAPASRREALARLDSLGGRAEVRAACWSSWPRRRP
jgi:hypothetical protein